MRSSSPPSTSTQITSPDRVPPLSARMTLTDFDSRPVEPGYQGGTWIPQDGFVRPAELRYRSVELGAWKHELALTTEGRIDAQRRMVASRKLYGTLVSAGIETDWMPVLMKGRAAGGMAGIASIQPRQSLSSTEGDIHPTGGVSRVRRSLHNRELPGRLPRRHVDPQARHRSDPSAATGSSRYVLGMTPGSNPTTSIKRMLFTFHGMGLRL